MTNNEQTNQNQQLNEIDAQVVAPSALEALQRADVDISIATAHRFPRKLHAVKQRMYEYATLDLETAEACNYSLRRKKKDGTYTEITGPTIRMAEIALSCYQNISGGSRVIEIGEEFVTAQGVCHDLENNVRIAVEVKNRITMNSADGRMLAAAAGCSKALRNAVFTVVPRALIKPIADAALQVVTGDTKTMVARRKDRIAEFKELGVSEKELLAYLEIESVEQIGVEQYRRLAGVLSAIRDKETSVEEEFGPRPLAGAQKAKAPAAPTSQKPSPPTGEQKATSEPSKNASTAEPPAPMKAAPPEEKKPEPKKAAAEKAKPKPQSTEKLIEAVRAKLSENKIEEQAVIDWMDALGVIPNTGVTLDQVAPKWLEMLLNKWDENLAAFASVKRKEESQEQKADDDDDFPA